MQIGASNSGLRRLIQTSASLRGGLASGDFELLGASALKRSLERWLGHSVFAQTG